jgi:hypothetical protein
VESGKPNWLLSHENFTATEMFREHTGVGWEACQSSQQRVSQQAGFIGLFIFLHRLNFQILFTSSVFKAEKFGQVVMKHCSLGLLKTSSNN